MKVHPVVAKTVLVLYYSYVHDGLCIRDLAKPTNTGTEPFGIEHESTIDLFNSIKVKASPSYLP